MVLTKVNAGVTDVVLDLSGLRSILLGRPNAYLYAETVVPYVGLASATTTQNLDGNASLTKTPSKQKRTKGMALARLDANLKSMPAAPSPGAGKVITISIEDPQVRANLMPVHEPCT